MSSGQLFLIPAALGDVPWEIYLPAQTRAVVCRLTHFIIENAKATRAELKRLGHPLPLREITIETLPEKASVAELERLLKPLTAGHDVGLFSDAGCPGVADPGALLVRHAHRLNVPVRPLVGPSSLLLALMASGLNGQRFLFHGYLPAREPQRSASIADLEKESRQRQQTQIFIETPYRNTALLEALLRTCRPETLLCLATDLSTPSESITTRSISQWRTAPPTELDRRPTVFLLLGV